MLLWRRSERLTETKTHVGIKRETMEAQLELEKDSTRVKEQ